MKKIGFLMMALLAMLALLAAGCGKETDHFPCGCISPNYNDD